ncbi:MAG: glycosyltransferase family 39 protein [Candidatus Sumerlaeaceae bacterium]|nr:glycosyltransferase family 39 protein [Candidatus Sumerlaeaceae bacterium]
MSTEVTGTESRRPPWEPWAAAAIVLLAAVLRLVALDSIPPGLWYDEAIYALDGLSIGHGNWPIFFTTEGHMREPLYIYYLGGFFALFGHAVWKARAATALWGIFGVALMWPVGKRVFGNARWALVGMFCLAVFRWHLHFSRSVFRAALPPVFILLVVVFFLRWRESRKTSDAILCGLFLGLGLYTYLSFRFIPIVLVVWVTWLLWHRQLEWRRDWRSLAMIVAVSVAVFLPLGVDYLRHPEHFSGRMDEVSMFRKTLETKNPDGSPGKVEVPKTTLEAASGLTANAWDIAKMWTVRGDHVGKHNLPYEPVFDWISGLFFYIGLIWCVVNSGRNEFAFLTLVWIFFMSLTSVFSFGAPNLLRMQGATPAVVMVYVFGLKWTWDSLARSAVKPTFRLAAVGALLALFASIQLDTYFRRFPRSLAVQQEFQKWNLCEPARAVLNTGSVAQKIYVPQEMADHPTFRFITWGVDNLVSYGPTEDAPTTATRPFAFVATVRSEDLAKARHKDPLRDIKMLNSARREFDFLLPTAERDGEPANWIHWGEMWLVKP